MHRDAYKRLMDRKTTGTKYGKFRGDRHAVVPANEWLERNMAQRSIVRRISGMSSAIIRVACFFTSPGKKMRVSPAKTSPL